MVQEQHDEPGKLRRRNPGLRSPKECSHVNWRPGRKHCPDCGKDMVKEKAH